MEGARWAQAVSSQALSGLEVTMHSTPAAGAGRIRRWPAGREKAPGVRLIPCAIGVQAQTHTHTHTFGQGGAHLLQMVDLVPQWAGTDLDLQGTKSHL
jgi:hypothetical protein